MEANRNIIKINIGGYGGEFVLGTITKEQHDYWKAQQNDKLEDYALDAFDYVKENKTPEDMDFLEQEGWHDCDNIAHNYGCDMESAWIEITRPDDSSSTYDSPYELRDIFETKKLNHLQYSPYDEMIREAATSNNPLPEGHYFTAYSSEKGQFIYTEFELPEHHIFDESRLVFFSHNNNDIDGQQDEVLESIAYIYPDDSPNEPTELSNEGGDTRGKGWECNLFEISYQSNIVKMHTEGR
jgi:hypothetical protein